LRKQIVCISKRRSRSPGRKTRLAYELNYVEKFLLLMQDNLTPEEKANLVDFVMKFQQLTGPLMAKGLKIRLYVYNRLMS